jgi:S-DNA-T family DNA segregation ATPase FtsK/SpoIIIE
LGAIMLAGCTAGALSLLTWSAADPSLAHATSGATHNLLGPIGAILSDLLMQMVGLGSVFVFLPPVFWGLQLLSGEQVEGVRTKLVAAPIAVILLASAFASLPQTAYWPLHHNYGGVLGDLSIDLAATPMSWIYPDWAWAAAGLLCFAGGVFLLGMSTGLTLRDVKQMSLEAQRLGRQSLRRGWRMLADFAAARRDAVSSYRMPSLHVEPTFEPTIEPTFEPTLDSAPRRTTTPPVMLLEPDESMRDASFDRKTERESRAIAERFAPQPSEGAAAALELSDDPTPPALAGAQTVYKLPPHSILRRPPPSRPAAELNQTTRQQATMLQDVLADFGVRGEVKDIHPGPVVTQFEFEPARGIKASRVIALADDIARSMSAESARVAVVPGRNAIGIELPNTRRETVFLREMFESDAFRSTDAILPLVLGKSINGTPVFTDLVRMPHLLVAGTTGSGKSVGVNAMILSLLHRLSPERCRFLMIDPKMLELSVYNGIPHLLAPVVTDARKAVAALNWVVGEMEDRYRRMASISVRNIDVFNNRVRTGRHPGGLEPMAYIVVVVDEFADLMIVAGKEIEAAVQRLAQMARAAGIHLIMSTQRPSVDVITGTIKANFPTRISFKVASKIDSRTILNEQGAEQLLGQGDMLFSAGTGRTLRVHGPFVSDEEVESIATYLREQGEPRYIDGITDTVDGPADMAAGPARSGADDLYERAVALVLADQKASTSYLQRRLGVGYNKAADLIERMEREGILSAPGHQGRRQIQDRVQGRETASPRAR